MFVNGRVVTAGIPSPGEILASDRRSIFFLVRSAGGEFIVEYRWRASG